MSVQGKRVFFPILYDEPPSESYAVGIRDRGIYLAPSFLGGAVVQYVRPQEAVQWATQAGAQDSLDRMREAYGDKSVEGLKVVRFRHVIQVEDI